MKAKKKPEKAFLCGEPKKFATRLTNLRVINADNEVAALFDYIEDRKEVLRPGDDVTVIELGSERHHFVLLADEALPVEEVEATND